MLLVVFIVRTLVSFNISNGQTGTIYRIGCAAQLAGVSVFPIGIFPISVLLIKWSIRIGENLIVSIIFKFIDVSDHLLFS